MNQKLETVLFIRTLLLYIYIFFLNIKYRDHGFVEHQKTFITNFYNPAFIFCLYITEGKNSHLLFVLFSKSTQFQFNIITFTIIITKYYPTRYLRYGFYASKGGGFMYKGRMGGREAFFAKFYRSDHNN